MQNCYSMYEGQFFFLLVELNVCIFQYVVELKIYMF